MRNKFVVCDLGAIETRVLGWVSGCRGIAEVFEKGLDPYIAFAVHLYKKPYDQITKHERQISKAAVLACGFMLSGGKEEINKDGDIIRTGLWGYANQTGVEMTKDEAHAAVATYRETYKEVVTCWANLQSAAIKAIKTGEQQSCHKVIFGAVKPKKLLYITLPSGRRLHYIRPELTYEEGWNGEERISITHEGNIQGTKKWDRIRTYAGKFCENIIQAAARDVLLNGMLLADQRGFDIVATTHDEIITVADENDAEHGLSQLRDCMISRPLWCADLPLAAEGFEDKIYRKN